MANVNRTAPRRRVVKSSSKSRRKPSIPEPAPHRLLQEACLRIEAAMATAITVAGALRHQGAEADEDFAMTLVRGCCDPLSAAVECIEKIPDGGLEKGS
jgi:hypothetical protein